MSSVFANRLAEKYRGVVKHIGVQSPVIQQIRNIRNNTSSDQQRLIVAEGMWAQQRLLDTALPVRSFLVCPELVYSREGMLLAESMIQRAGEAFIVSKKLFDRISDREGPDGFVSLVQIPPLDANSIKLDEHAIVVVLDGLETPGNIGTILRTCDGAGVDAVLICNKRARITNPKLVKGSMGAVFTLPLLEFDNVAACAGWLRARRFCICLADTRADETYKSFDYRDNTALIIGSERYGISREWYDWNPRLLSIPMLGGCDSLNAGVAASIITYEMSMKRAQRGCRQSAMKKTLKMG